MCYCIRWHAFMLPVAWDCSAKTGIRALYFCLFLLEGGMLRHPNRLGIVTAFRYGITRARRGSAAQTKALRGCGSTTKLMNTIPASTVFLLFCQYIISTQRLRFISPVLPSKEGIREVNNDNQGPTPHHGPCRQDDSAPPPPQGSAAGGRAGESTNSVNDVCHQSIFLNH